MLVGIVFAALAFRLFRLTAEFAVNIFYWDQWDFDDATLFQKHSLWEIFRWQHGPHRQGMGGLLQALVDPWLGWDSRAEAFVATGLVVLLGLFVLYLKYRLCGPLVWTDAALPVIVFTPAQWAANWSSFNFAHGSFPVLLIVIYCLLWLWRNERWKYALIVVLNFGILYTGFGIFIGLLTPALLLARLRGATNRRYLGACVLLSVGSLASFFVNYRNLPASGCDSLFAPPVGDYFSFLDLLYSTPFAVRGTGVPSLLIGGAVLAAVIAIAAVGWKSVWIKRGAPRPLLLVLAILSAYSLLFCVAATLGRTCTGVAEAHASRYAHYMQLPILCLYFAALELPWSRWRWLLPACLLALLIPSIFPTSYDSSTMETVTLLKVNWRDCYLAGHPVDFCQNQAGQIYPDPEFAHLQEKLNALRAAGLNLFDGPPPAQGQR